MSNKIASLLAGFALVVFAGWFQAKSGLSDMEQRRISYFCLAFVFVMSKIALCEIRMIILKRRLQIRRIYRQSPTEELRRNADVQTLATIRARIIILNAMRLYVILPGNLVALHFKMSSVALILNLFTLLAAMRAQALARTFEKSRKPDPSPPNSAITAPFSPSGRYMVAVNMEKLRTCLDPYFPELWTLFFGPWKWLSRCGFTFLGDKRWVCDETALARLDAGEIISMAPLPQ